MLKRPDLPFGINCRKKFGLPTIVKKTKRRIDLKGQKFGKLTVLNYIYTRQRHIYWKCICACGNSTVARTGSLRRGIHKSCGCARIEAMKNFWKIAKEKNGN